MTTIAEIVQLLGDAHKRFRDIEGDLAGQSDKILGFIDLSASTQYKKGAPDERLGITRSLFHLILCTKILEDQGCTQIKYIGDEVMFSATSATDAIEACEAVRIAYELLDKASAYPELRPVRALLGLNQPNSIPMSAKSGISKGRVFQVPRFLSPDDGLGLPIDYAARCISKGLPGFIVVDEGIHAELSTPPSRLPSPLHMSDLVMSFAKGLGTVYMALVGSDRDKVREVAPYALDPWSGFEGHFNAVDHILDALQLLKSKNITSMKLSESLWVAMRSIEEVLAHLREIDRDHVHGGSLMLVYTRSDIARMRKAYEKAQTGAKSPSEGEFLARRIPFIGPKWRDPLPKEDQDVYITVEFYTHVARDKSPRESYVTLCGNRPERSKAHVAHVSTLNSFFFPELNTVFRYAYGLAANGNELSTETQRLIEQNYAPNSWQAQQVGQHAKGAGFRSSIRIKVVDKEKCIGYVCIDSDLEQFGVAERLLRHDIEYQERRVANILKPLVRMMGPAVARLRELHIEEFEKSPDLEPDLSA